MDALRVVNAKREAAGIEDLIHKTTLHRFVNSKTHRRGRKETRGRKKLLTKADLLKLEQTRRRLIKTSQKRVCYADVLKASGLKRKASQRTIEDGLREKGVRFRAPREKIYITADDAKTRLKVCNQWLKKPASYWSRSVRAYVDNKAWPAPLTPKQRAHYRQTRITGHLRKASEGIEKGFTKPRTKHSWTGVPSITVAAAVNKKRVIMWHTLDKPWNGTTAADMYQGPLLAALRRTYGKKKSYTIVEDGDRKGNQSGKGLQATSKAKIRALTLPPRRPSLMPLDFALWHEIENRMEKSMPKGRETKEAFIKRLEKTARALPPSLVGKAVGRMKPNVKAIVDAKGWHPKND